MSEELKHFIVSLFKGARKPKSLSSQYEPNQALQNLKAYFDSIKNSDAYKSGAYVGSKSLSAEDYVVQMDPYSSAAKIQFEENARAEPMTRSALRKNMNYLFAKGIKTVLDTMYDDFDTT